MLCYSFRRRLLKRKRIWKQNYWPRPGPFHSPSPSEFQCRREGGVDIDVYTSWPRIGSEFRTLESVLVTSAWSLRHLAALNFGWFPCKSDLFEIKTGYQAPLQDRRATNSVADYGLPSSLDIGVALCVSWIITSSEAPCWRLIRILLSSLLVVQLPNEPATNLLSRTFWTALK